jgi:hypothetical protein
MDVKKGRYSDHTQVILIHLDLDLQTHANGSMTVQMLEAHHGNNSWVDEGGQIGLVLDVNSISNIHHNHHRL